MIFILECSSLKINLPNETIHRIHKKAPTLSPESALICSSHFSTRTKQLLKKGAGQLLYTFFIKHCFNETLC